MVGTTAINLDEFSLDKSLNEILKQTADFLGFGRGEIVLVRDEHKRVKPASSYKEEKLFLDFVTHVGLSDADAENEIKNSKMREKQKNMDLTDIRPYLYALRTKSAVQCYDNEDFIRELESKGVVKQNYYDWSKLQYNEYIARTQEYGEKAMGFSDWFRFAIFPIILPFNGKQESAGYFNFDEPKEIQAREAISDYKVNIAQLMINYGAYISIVVAASEEERRLAQAQLVSTENLRVIGKFARGVAHDVSNMVYSQIETAQHVQESIKEGTMPTEKLLNFLENIVIKARAMHRMARGLRDYAREGSIERVDGNLNECIEITLNVLGPDLRDKKITVRTELDSNLPRIEMVPWYLNQIYTNLIENSVEAIERKRALIGDTDYNPEIMLTTRIMDRVIYSSVGDNGIGIRPECLERIFEPSFSTREEVGRGSRGLGLSICRNYIREHEGEIKVKSVYGEGTEFTIEIPL